MRAVLLCLVVTVTVAVVAVGIVMRERDEDPGEQVTEAGHCLTGFDVCGDEGVVEAELLVWRCPSADRCVTQPLDARPFLEFI